MTDETASPDIADVLDGEEGLAAVIARLEAENAQLKDQALRFAAEAENTRRRAERDTNDARAYAIQRFANDLLGVADNLARALGAVPVAATDPALKSLVRGVEMTEKEMLQAFERNGLKPISPQPGDRFDPNTHQAMMEQSGGKRVPPGAVIQTLQTGWELFGRLVRPAMVVTASKPVVHEVQGYGEPENGSGEALDTKA